MATALVTQAGIKKRFFMFYFSSLSFSFFLNTGSDCQTDQHTQGDADAGVVPKGGADGRTKTHSQAHALCPIIVDLFFFLFPSRTSCSKHCKKQTHHNPRQRRPKKIKYIFRKIISFYLFTFLKNKK